MLYKNRIEVPGEVIFEVITAEDGEGFGQAIVDIHASKEHYHTRTVEFYTLISGRLAVYINGKATLLESPGDTAKIPIGAWHWAESRPESSSARVSVITIPAWSESDHILK
ncbi:MAG: cupin domain-containing protein [Candidatus Sungbacteria bacterium]|nr:cupin domain-containing protein [Candidatus Sungbacteria bacterium]